MCCNVRLYKCWKTVLESVVASRVQIHIYSGKKLLNNHSGKCFWWSWKSAAEWICGFNQREHQQLSNLINRPWYVSICQNTGRALSCHYLWHFSCIRSFGLDSTDTIYYQILPAAFYLLQPRPAVKPRADCLSESAKQSLSILCILHSAGDKEPKRKSFIDREQETGLQEQSQSCLFFKDQSKEGVCVGSKHLWL